MEKPRTDSVPTRECLLTRSVQPT